MANVTLGTLRDYWKALSDIIKTKGAATGTKGLQVAGSDGTNAQILKTNADGELITTLSGSIESLTTDPVTGIKTVTATAAEIFAGSSAKANRRKLVVKNEDKILRFRIGADSVTQQNGFPVEPGAIVEIQFDPGTAVAIYGISEGASLSVAVMEV